MEVRDGTREIVIKSCNLCLFLSYEIQMCNVDAEYIIDLGKMVNGFPEDCPLSKYEVLIIRNYQ